MEYRRICDDKSIMNMTMLMHNCVFIKDGAVWYRDFTTEKPLTELMRELYAAYKGPDFLGEIDDDELNEMLMDNGQFGINDIEGLFSLLNTVMVGFAEVREWLKEYENVRIPSVIRPKTIHKAIEHYGETNQLLKAIEEMNELSRAICRYLEAVNGQGNQQPEQWKVVADARANVYEELGDVTIMMRQMFDIFGCQSRTAQVIEEKLDRLEENIKKETAK